MVLPEGFAELPRDMQEEVKDVRRGPLSDGLRGLALALTPRVSC